MVRVGIDLTALPRLKGGVAFYLVELVGALQRIDFENEYWLLARREHAQELRRLAPRFTTIGIRLPSRPIRLAWEQSALPRLAARLRLDVLHSPHYTRPLAPLPCASVVGVMDMTFFALPEHHTFIKRLFFRAMIPASARRADRLIAISESTKQDIERWLGIPGDRIDVTPLAVSPAYREDIDPAAIADVRRRYDLPADYVLYVGRLEPRKNLPRLLQAYGILTARRPSTPALVLAGAPGWHRAELDAALRPLAGRVRLPGYVPEADLPALYAGARVFVYPSLYEGFGIPVLEALSCGVPTITSGVSSMREVAGAAAELIDPLDMPQIADAIERLLEDTGRQLELKTRARDRARDFSWDTTAALTRESYQKAHDVYRRG
ncbi:MAG: glycosyltransferase family 1 protein [Acidobacteria bacterium]|nr:MAG: glycosyltransferase family 1 protein [Acidobacteriota bacterium]